MFRRFTVILLLAAALAACTPGQLPATPAAPNPTPTSAPAATATSVPPTTAPTAPPTDLPPGSPMPVDLLCAPGGTPDAPGSIVCGGVSYGFELQVSEPGSLIDQGTDPTNGAPYARIALEPEVPGTTLGNKLFNLWVYPGTSDEDECFELLMRDVQESYPSDEVEVNGIPFTRATGISAALGTAYHWTRYSAVSPSGNCVNLEFALGIANEGNFATPPPTPDVALESAVFDQILATFRWLP